MSNITKEQVIEWLSSQSVLDLAALVKANDEVRVFISGDKDARHGDVIRVLDIVRGTGIQKVAFEIRTPEGK